MAKSIAEPGPQREDADTSPPRVETAEPGGSRHGWHVAIWIIAAILVLAGLRWAQVLAAPLAFAVFLIALVWPLQAKLESHLPRGLAAIISVIPVLVGGLLVIALIAFGIGAVRTALPDYAPQLEDALQSGQAWLVGFGLEINPQVADQFGPTWLLHLVHEAALRANVALGFLALTLIFLALGLLEASDLRARMQQALPRATAEKLLAAGEELGRKYRRYMLVRSMVSVLTGGLTWGFAVLVGLDLAAVWGSLAFALNFIPFVGSILAVIPPVVFAVVQFDGWLLPLLTFAGMALIQFSIGNFLDPRLEGRALAISPFLVVVSVFFWGLIWGLPGAFIGVPLTIAIIVVCQHFHSLCWVAQLAAHRGRTAPPELGR